jgi:multidrug transporter EmrE-like cation transporter
VGLGAEGVGWIHSARALDPGRYGCGEPLLLALALKELPVGVGYAVWTGIGTIGVAVAGMILLDEAASAGRILSIGLITMWIVLFALTD